MNKYADFDENFNNLGLWYSPLCSFKGSYSSGGQIMNYIRVVVNSIGILNMKFCRVRIFIVDRARNS